MTSTNVTPTTAAPIQKIHQAPVSRGGKVRRAMRKLLVPLLILIGCGALWMYVTGAWSKDRRDTLPPENPRSDSAQLMVTAEPVAFRPVKRVVEASGTLYGFEEIVISAKVEGHVLRIHHEVADHVAPNELMVEIDRTDYQLAVEQAQSNLEVELAKLGLQDIPNANFDLSKVPTVMLAQARVDNTKSQWERIQRLAEEDAASKSEVENALSEFRTAEADHANQMLLAKSGLAMIELRRSDLAIANQQLANTEVRAPRPHQMAPDSDAPVTYVIVQRSVAEGSFLRAGGEICRLAIDKTLKLRVPIPERYSAQIKLGQRADVFTAAFADPFSGVVTLINPSVAPSTRAFDVEIQIANPQGELKPGSFAKAIIQIGQTDEAATVPLSAIVTFAGVTKVFLAENGKAKEVLVTPGVQTREWIEIAKPEISPGAVVITSGQALLARETPIRIREPAVPAAAARRTESGAAQSSNMAANRDKEAMP